MFSMQQLVSTSRKSATVRQLNSHVLFPLNFARFSNFGASVSFQVFSSSLAPSGEQAMMLSFSMHSPMTPSKLRMTALSCTFLPKSSPLLLRSTMYEQMAEVSVILRLPSIRYGRLGKSICKFCLSPPNHCSGEVYWMSSQTAPVYASSKRGTWPLPLTRQYPKVTLPFILYLFTPRYSLSINHTRQKINGIKVYAKQSFNGMIVLCSKPCQR